MAGLDAEWAGLSLTMPLKEVALDVADEVGAGRGRDRRGQHAGPPAGRPWRAENTDAPGMVDALPAAG